MNWMDNDAAEWRHRPKERSRLQGLGGAEERHERLYGTAPWWRCLHCGYGKYGVHNPLSVKCLDCGALHSPPDPDSKTALRWQISELTALIEQAAAALESHGHLSFAAGLREKLAIAMETRRAETPSGSVPKA